MPKAGYCKKCKKNVWLEEDGSCQFGHSASSVSNVYEAQPQTPGKYKYNILVWKPNILKLLEKSVQTETMPFDIHSGLIKYWAFACTFSVDGIIESLLFRGEAETPFKKNLNKLDKERVFEMIKLLVGFHLTVFMRNKASVALLKGIKLPQKTFKEGVFSFFSFTEEDKKIFRELDRELDKEYRSDPPIKYDMHLYDKIFERAYGMPSEAKPSVIIALSIFLRETGFNFLLFWGEFLKVLGDQETLEASFRKIKDSKA